MLAPSGGKGWLVDAAKVHDAAGVLRGDVLIEEARRRQRRRRKLLTLMILIVLIVAGVSAAIVVRHGAPRGAIAGARQPSNGAGQPVGPVSMRQPEALATLPDGSVLIADQGRDQVLRRAPTGQLTVFAGDGRPGYGGDGGPATSAQINNPGGLAVAGDGTVYLADTGNNRVRAISPSGIITTFAGNGSPGTTSTAAVPADAAVGQPEAVAITASRNVYVVDDAGVQLVAPSSGLQTIIAAGAGLISYQGAPAAFFPNAITIDGNGDLFVSDFSPKLLVQFTPTGKQLRTWDVYVTSAGLDTAPDGDVLVADYGFSIDRIHAGQLTQVATYQLGTIPGLSGVFRPSGVTAGSNGIYTDTDGVNGGTNAPALARLTTNDQTQLLATGTPST